MFCCVCQAFLVGAIRSVWEMIDGRAFVYPVARRRRTNSIYYKQMAKAFRAHDSRRITISRCRSDSRFRTIFFRRPVELSTPDCECINGILLPPPIRHQNTTSSFDNGIHRWLIGIGDVVFMRWRKTKVHELHFIARQSNILYIRLSHLVRHSVPSFRHPHTRTRQTTRIFYIRTEGDLSGSEDGKKQTKCVKKLM